jgi:hypothetical protein
MPLADVFAAPDVQYGRAMGSDAHVYVFDHAGFVEQLVPAILGLLRTGHKVPALADLWYHHTDDPWSYLGSADLTRDCSYLRITDLAFEGRPAAPRPWFDDWSERACRSEACPSRTTCPLFDGHQTYAEAVTWLVTHAVGVHHVGASRFVGRTVNIGFYDGVLQDAGVPESHPVRGLLRALGNRGRVIGYGFGNSDGIHGWLDPGETHALAEELHALPLPRYPATFEAMDAVMPEPYQPPAGFQFQHVSLSFVRTVAEIAAQDRRGILWGNDLPLHNWKEHSWRTRLARHQARQRPG